LKLPTALEAERSLVGNVLSGEISARSLTRAVGIEDFSLEAHRKILAAAVAVEASGLKVNRVSVFEELQKRGHVEAVGGIGALVDLVSEKAPICGIEDTYIRLVRDTAVLRRAMKIAQSFIVECQSSPEPAASVLEKARAAIQALSIEVSNGHGPKTIAEIIAASDHGIDGLLSPCKFNPGLPWAWSDLGRLVAPLVGGQLVVVGARPAIGKTTVLLQQACYCAARGTKVLLASLEMGWSEIIQRIACMLAGVNMHDLRVGHTTEEERRRILAELTEVSDNLLIETNIRTVGQLEAAVLKASPRLVLLDYLQLLTARGMSRVEQITAISRDLKLLAMETGVPVVAAAQLNRASAAERRMPKLHDLRDSGSIEMDADVVVLLHRLEKPGDRGENAAFIVAKQRNGPTGIVPMLFHGQYSRFEQLAPAGAYAG
jgi:replicative DNA helicase